MRRNPQVVAVLALALLVAALAVPVLADDTTPPPSGPNNDIHAWYILTHPKALAAFLGLSPDQITQSKPLWDTLRTANNALRDQRPALCSTLEAALGTNPPDPGTVGAATIDLFNNRESVKANRATFDAGFEALLTAVQLAKYNALKELALAEDPYFSPIGQCPRNPS